MGHLPSRLVIGSVHPTPLPSQGWGKGGTGFLVDDSPTHNAMPWKHTLRTVFLFYLIAAIFFFFFLTSLPH